MMANEILARLLAVTAAASLAALAVMLLRPLLRRWFGAGVAYGAWLLLPVAVIAAAMPAGTAPREVQVLASPLAGMSGAVSAPAVEAPAQVALAVLAVWVSLALLAAAWQLLRYRRFVRSLGPLDHRGGVAYAPRADAGPMLLGVLHPLVVLPADFEIRYTAGERELIVAHERLHASRGDPLANALCAVAQCFWWFNPVIHLAAQRFRMDQELACDQAVMRSRPGTARVYAGAMLKTQLSDSHAPFACQWQSTHPLKERILNLNRSSIGAVRRIAGRMAVAFLMATGAWSAWAAQSEVAADAPTYDIAMVLTADGQTSTPSVKTRAGEDVAISVASDKKQWTIKMSISPSGEDTVTLRSTLTLDGKVVSAPVLMVKLDQPGSIVVGTEQNFRLAFTVRKGQPAS